MPSFLVDTYSITNGTYCEPLDSDLKLASTLSDAKIKCGRDDACIGFYYDGSTKDYYQCTTPLTTSDKYDGSIIYMKNGNL